MIEFKKIKGPYEGKNRFDLVARKNIDAFVGDVSHELYLPRYSSREDNNDYEDRLKRSENNYFNFVRKIFEIYQNAIFRFTEPVRKIENDELKIFAKDVTGSGLALPEFTKERVFLLQQIQGGVLIVVDKPPIPGNKKLSKLEQMELGIFPYAYTIPWTNVENFRLDKKGNLDWVLYREKNQDGETVYTYWDKNNWARFDSNGGIQGEGTHGLGVVPCIRAFAMANPKYNFQVPMSPMDDIVRITLKIFELMSQLDQMIIGHVYLKLAMPKSMYDEIKKSGMGTYNVLVFEDTETEKAYYVNTPATEMKTLIDLIFNKYPAMILEMATVRDKTNVPREESGVAKFYDSSDELANLLKKAEQMEKVENDMLKIAAKWEDIEKPEFTIQYSKNFDIKSTNEQIEEMIKIFKEVNNVPTFAKEMLRRAAKKVLGNVDERTWEKIEKEIENTYDPSLNLDDIDKLINNNLIILTEYFKKLNPEFADKPDEEIQKIMAKNMKMKFNLFGAEQLNPTIPVDSNE